MTDTLTSPSFITFKTFASFKSEPEPCTNYIGELAFINMYADRKLDCDILLFFQLPPVHQPKPVITPRWIIPTTAVSFFEFAYL